MKLFWVLTWAEFGGIVSFDGVLRCRAFIIQHFYCNSQNVLDDEVGTIINCACSSVDTL